MIFFKSENILSRALISICLPIPTLHLWQPEQCPPQRYTHTNPQSSEYDAFYGKRDLTNVIKSMSLKLDSLGGPNIITSVLVKGRRKKKSRVGERAERCYTSGFEERRSHEPRNAGCLQKLEKAGKMFLLYRFQKEYSLANTLI